MGDLIGTLYEFFKKLGNVWQLLSNSDTYSGVDERIVFFVGIKKLRFKPAYNPYTEPSMEVFSYHEGNLLTSFKMVL